MQRRISTGALSDVFERIRSESEIPVEFTDEQLEAARQARPLEIERTDLRHLPFVTVDPPDAQDLDQAMCFESRPKAGIRVRYAIADVASFVAPGDPLDDAARRRGTTVYCPDRRVGLHPSALSEGSASLLPGQVRPAIVFRLDVDREGSVAAVQVERALVESKRRYDYRQLQSRFDAGSPPEALALLRAFGEARVKEGVKRGALTLRLPEQEVVPDGDAWRLELRKDLPTEAWNAEVSLLTGMVAADLMEQGGMGILRTLPPPDEVAIGQMRGAVKSLGIAWTSDESASELLASLDPSEPRQMAVFEAATRLLRGAGYGAFGEDDPTKLMSHAGVASTYAHVTAPLRRLVDRFGLEIALAVSQGTEVPGWVAGSLEEIASTMTATDQRAGKVERTCLDAVEAWMMQTRVGREHDAIVLAGHGGGVEVWIDEPPIMSFVPGVKADPGDVIRLRVDGVEVDRGIIHFKRND